jgi:hypothetical protein
MNEDKALFKNTAIFMFRLYIQVLFSTKLLRQICDSEVFLLLVYLKYGRSGKTKDYIKLIFPASALNTQHKKERPKTG